MPAHLALLLLGAALAMLLAFCGPRGRAPFGRSALPPPPPAAPWQPQAPAPAAIHGRRRRTEGYRPHVTGVERDYKHASLPKPGRGSPLAPALAKATDAAASLPSMAPGDTLPHDAREVQGVLAQVLRRINVRTPSLRLELVSFDNVTKTVDGYKTIRYVMDANVYSRTRNVASKITAAVDVTSSGKMYVRDLAVHGADRDTVWVAPSNGPGTEEPHAPFEPVLRL